MKKIFLGLSVFFLLFGLIASSAQAAIIFDDFNDGNTDGWVFEPSLKIPSDYGNWRVESGMLVENTGGDGYIALLDNFYMSDQIVETLVKPVGWSGIIIWFQDHDNLVWVELYPGTGTLWVAEMINGVYHGTPYSYPVYSQWYTLKLEADSTNGNIGVLLNGDFIFNHPVLTTNRTGRSGLITGNAGGYFDYFKVDSINISPFIDIKPGDNANIINLRGMKSINVAILSSPYFSATTQVNRSTLTFGKQGSEESLISCSRKGKDVNGDGLVDLVCTFSINLTGFQCGDTEGVLKGKMNLSGITFEEKQQITVAPCK